MRQLPITNYQLPRPPLNPESPHAYWLRRNRAAFADSGVATPALVAPHPFIDWRGELVVISWRFMASQ
jgi:hypothetical protein